MNGSKSDYKFRIEIQGNLIQTNRIKGMGANFAMSLNNFVAAAIYLVYLHRLLSISFDEDGQPISNLIGNIEPESMQAVVRYNFKQRNNLRSQDLGHHKENFEYIYDVVSGAVIDYLQSLLHYMPEEVQSVDVQNIYDITLKDQSVQFNHGELIMDCVKFIESLRVLKSDENSLGKIIDESLWSIILILESHLVYLSTVKPDEVVDITIFELSFKLKKLETQNREAKEEIFKSSWNDFFNKLLVLTLYEKSSESADSDDNLGEDPECAA